MDRIAQLEQVHTSCLSGKSTINAEITRLEAELKNDLPDVYRTAKQSRLNTLYSQLRRKTL